MKRLSTNSGFINWRPSVQHELMKSDRHYDLELYCYKKYEQICKSIYVKTIELLHEKLVNDILEEYMNFRSENNNTNTNYIKTIFINSYISVKDRGTLLDIISQHLETKYQAIVSTCYNYNTNSAHDILVEIGESLVYNIQNTKDAEKRKRVDVGIKVPSEIMEDLQDFPEQAIIDLLFNYIINNVKLNNTLLNDDDEPPIFVIILRKVETMKSTVFGDLLERLQRMEKIRFFVIIGHSSTQELPLLLRAFPQSLLDVHIQYTTTPWDMYDLFMKNILINNDMNVSLPAKLLGILHSDFNRTSKCVYTTYISLLNYYEAHFTSGMSVLSEYKDKDFLSTFNIIESGRRADIISADESLARFIIYLQDSDLDLCGIEFHKKGEKTVIREDTISAFTQQMNDSWDYNQVIKAWFGTLIAIRDCIMNKAANRYGYSSDILCAGLLDISNSERKQTKLPKFFHDFIGNIKLEFKSVPLKQILFMFDEIYIHLSSLYSRITWNNYKIQLNETRIELHKYKYLLEEAIVDLVHLGLHSGMNWRKIHKILHSNDNSSSISSDYHDIEENLISENIEYMIDDFMSWLIKSMQMLYELNKTCNHVRTGILIIKSELIDQVHYGAHSDLRKRFMRELCNENKIDSAENMMTRLDMVIIYDILESLLARKIQTLSCFQKFLESVEKSNKKAKSTANATTNASNVRSKSTTDEDSILKCRFIEALHSLEIHGFVRITTSGAGSGGSSSMIICQLYNWLKDDEE